LHCARRSCLPAEPLTAPFAETMKDERIALPRLRGKIFSLEGTMALSASTTSRFELAPPRRFILPAILLLLSEQPGYGYALLPCLQELRLGHVDRPAVYRALAQLERDGLVEVSPEHVTSGQRSKAGQARRVYRVTPLGERVLREWMRVIKEEHDRLGHVLRRYQATGTTDAVLAEVDGAWAAALGPGWSPVAGTSEARRPLASVDGDRNPPDPGLTAAGHYLDPAGEGGAREDQGPALALEQFELLPDRSVILVEVRSTVGPLSFGAIGVTGMVRAAIARGVVHTELPPSGRLEVAVSTLSSGNSLYDAELLRRIDARRFPTAAVELRECAASSPGARYRLKGELTFHGFTRMAEGTVCVEATSDHRLVITGEQVFDIRDYAVTSPTVLMLRIYPDVRVRLHAEAELGGRGEGG